MTLDYLDKYLTEAMNLILPVHLSSDQVKTLLAQRWLKVNPGPAPEMDSSPKPKSLYCCGGMVLRSNCEYHK